MNIDRSAIKAEARDRLSSAVPKPYWEGLIFVILSGIMTALSLRSLSLKITPEAAETYLNYALAGSYEQAVRYLDKLRPSTLESLVSFVVEVFRSIVAAGFSIFAVNTLRRRPEASLWNLLDGFSRFFPLLILVLLSNLLLTVWFQLLIIPGILAFYRYRMAVYLFLDHPELPPLQCILFSGGLMRGHKWELFLLDLSFIGWHLLAALPLTVGTFLPGQAGMILGAIGSAAIYGWLVPYMELSNVGFYEVIKSNLRIEPREPSDY